MNVYHHVMILERSDFNVLFASSDWIPIDKLDFIHFNFDLQMEFPQADLIVFIDDDKAMRILKNRTE